MMIKANIGMALSSLVSSKQRSFLALLGIVIGIGAVIALVSIGIIYQDNTLKSFLKLGTDYVVIKQDWRSKGWGEDANDPKIDFNASVELNYTLDSIVQASPLGSTGAEMTFRGKDISASILAVTENFLTINQFKMAEGRFISDLDEKMHFCVLGSEVVGAIVDLGYERSEILGESIKINHRLFTIVGILEEAVSEFMHPFYINGSLLIPYSIYEHAFDKPEVDSVLARMNTQYPTDQVIEEVQSYYSLRNPELTVEVQTAKKMIEQMANQMKMITIFLGAIGGISLVVGGVGVMNVMLVSVTERKKEIGIRRSLGAFQRDIQLQFLIEALVLCILGGIIGITMGVGASYVFSSYYSWDFLISVKAIWLGLSVSTAIGLFFGYYPARQAAKMNPIDALRSE